MASLWILGEGKSGKSELAEEIFARLPGPKLYIGTLPRTAENLPTIAKHAARRPKSWHLVEVADTLAPAWHWLSRREGEVCVLLDGWGVYATTRAQTWHPGPGERAETAIQAFADEVAEEYRRFAGAARYLVVVAHVAARFPAPEEIRDNPVRARVRAATHRCMTGADEVVFHDRVTVTHEDAEFVEALAARLRQLGAGGSGAE